MVEEIDFENRRISNFQALVTLTFDWVMTYHIAALIDLYPHQISFQLEKLFADDRHPDRLY